MQQLASNLDKDLIIQLQQEQLHRQARLITMLDTMNAEQAKMIKLLEARIEVLEHHQKKDSTTSSKPPSSDIGKPQRTRSLRTNSAKKPGGQQGHRGETLCFSEAPHEVLIHAVKQCRGCGKSLLGSAVEDYECRQVFDLPPMNMLITEHRSEMKSCPCCHTLNKAVFPEGVNQSVQYGINVQQLAVYFTQYQLLPYGRTAQIFKDLFGHALSSSFLVNNNHRCAVNLAPFIKDLKATLLHQAVLHADETGFYYASQRNWLHTLSTEKHTFYAPHIRRGTEAMQDMGVLPVYEGILVHDFWKPYNDFECGHALCNVHHLRDLTFCHDIEKSSWAGQAKQMLLDLRTKVMLAKEAGETSLSKGQLHYWRKKYDALIKEGLRLHPVAKKQKGKRGVTKKSKTQNLIERFVGYKEQILAFTHNFLVPFGNNLAEQAIRMMKVKQKISGCFRSEQGAKDFAAIRSYISTMKKQGQPILQALAAAIQGSPLKLTG
ncbi:MAG: IS66 family transposase [Flavisolibacter sp.]|nr:IS66 family transposase [Flavisolibacter sp.]